MKIEFMSLDLETRSSIDITKAGVYKYAESPDFDILLFGVSVNGGPVAVYDLASRDKVPEEIIKALSDDSVTKWAYNASFERVCLSVWLRRNYPQHFSTYSIEGDPVQKYLEPAAWKCTLIWAAYNGLPLSLDKVGAVLGFEEQKLKEGKELIRYFCMPSRTAGRKWNLPEHTLDKWELFKKYNRRDVEVEMQIQQRLKNYPVPDFVWDEYHLDQEINDRGIMIDRQLVEQAISIDEQTKKDLMARMQKLTGLDNPNSVMQLKGYLADNGLDTETLGKKDVAALLKSVPADMAEVLELRLQLAKSSVKKYQAMQNAVCDDDRCHGMFQFYGANRSGRWAGRLIQLQNLPQNHMSDLEQARVIAWLAGEKWRMDLFKNGGDIYCMSASQMFKVPVEKHGVNGHLRQKGKIAELACIAEDQPVLTRRGLVPIQNVKLEDELWDGESWVHHGGVVFKGKKKVIEYEGLTATADHLVWIEGKSEPVYFGYASSCGAHLVQTGNGRNPIRLGENYICRKTMESENEPLLCSNSMHRLQCYPLDKPECSNFRKIKGLSGMFAEKNNSFVALQKIVIGKTTMYQSLESRLQKLWRAWHQIWVSFRNRCGAVFDRSIRSSFKGDGIGSHRHEWRLCSRQPSILYPLAELHKLAQECSLRVQTGILALFQTGSYTNALERTIERTDNRECKKSSIREKKTLENHRRTARLYDIRNAGPHHRFTVSGHLVHNCGYGGGIGALKAMGALEMGLKEEELQPLVTAWRNSNPNIVKFWWAVDNPVMTAIKERTTTETRGLKFTCRRGMLFITLPSGRKLAYVKPRIGINQFGGESVTYEGIGATKKWERIESYGPKFVENIVQAIARDILCYAMKALQHCSIVMHIHDELVIEANPRISLDAVCEQMGRTPS